MKRLTTTKLIYGCAVMAGLLFFAAAGGTVRAEEEIPSSAENAASTEVPVLAENLTKELQITLSGGQGRGNITDDSIYTFASFQEGETVTLKCDKEIGSLYIMWNKLPKAWSGAADGEAFSGGEKGFLHEYVALENPARSVVINIPEGGAQITDVYAFSQGEPPDWVQVWEEPCARADVLLFSTHSDDDQLFFAGILPYYAMERKAYVQVVYGTNHWDTVTRPHEQLNGLWTVGVRNYPVISDFPDDARSLGSTSESRETVLARAKGVYDEEEWIRFEVRMLRRFQPQVVVNHDINGEYRHGAHILNTDALMQALELSGDASYDTESAQGYGVWDVPKTYLHLYDQNQLVMDWDMPYDSMGGRTPFEMSKLGYACHYSQQWTWFTDWITEEKAADIKRYSPCQYGLYRTTVGEDVEKNDLLENIVTYARQEELAEEERLRAEEAKRQEEERLRAEEAKRQEEERLRAEEAKRQEEERLRAEEAERQEEERLQAERGAFVRTVGIIVIAVFVILLLPAAIAAFRLIRRQRRRKRRKAQERGKR